MNGWIIAERHIQSVLDSENDFLADAIEKEKTILKRADVISVVSTPQKFAVIGEMAILGLLSKKIIRPAIEVVENACTPLREGEKRSPSEKTVFRGALFPPDATALLWIGGINAWADGETLFAGVERAMRENSKVHLVITGGALKGIDEKQFGKFRKNAEQSEFSNRFHFLGWVEAEKMPALFHECDAGLNVDRLCPETETGARNRLNEFLRYGLPIISTAGSAIAQKIGEKNAGRVVESGNVEDLSQALLLISRGGDTIEKIRYNGRKMALEDCSIAKTTAPLENFLKNPRRAERISPVQTSLSAGISYWKTRGTKAFLKKCRQKISEKIGF